MARIPLATYRLQFNKDFRFADACKILDYLRDLGISDVYASPILSSRRGSPHGYDATDPTRIDPDLGSEEDFARLQRELETRGMGLILDIVPNHMAASSENPWWMDVLENGPASSFASYFDIDWHPPSRTLDNKILLPVLGKPFGEALDGGELQLARQDERFFIRYYESLFPLAPHSYRRVLNHRSASAVAAGAGSTRLRETVDNPAVCDEFEGILAGLNSLFESAASSAAGSSPADRRLKFDALRDRLRQLFISEPRIADLVDENVRTLNGAAGDAPSVSSLERLLGEQHYKLAYWQDTNETINYRRFFTITDLVGLRIEDPLVFDAAHAYLLRTLVRSAFTGLRVDHIDGLRDPFSYLAKLQDRLGSAQPSGSNAGGGEAAATRPFLLVEKILERHEQLPADWPISGTTGYDYLNFANGLFVNASNGPALERIYAGFIARTAEWPEILYQKKKLVMSILLNAEMRALGRMLGELAAEDRYAREIPRAELSEALIEVTASLGAYRTYIRNLDVPDEARDVISSAIARTRERRPQLNSRALDFLGDVLLLGNRPHVFPEQREARLAFVMRWQQFTGPIVAKGLEDTALYVYFPLLSLSEVGGDPRASEAATRDDFHHYIEQRRKRWPHSLNATTTHDTKRSEDARMRINALSDIPEQWSTRLTEWSAQNLSLKSDVDGQLVPDRNEEYLLYQTLLGVWPPCPVQPDERAHVIERVQAYVVKATREAMVHTRWTRPNEAHENALTQFVARVLDPSSGPFLNSFCAFHREIASTAAKNSLGQTLLKIVAPGVPDFHQGSELWDLRLVDPDNRTPVDFASRESFLAELREKFAKATPEQLCGLLSNWQNGKAKLYVAWKALAARAAHRALFESGDYVPLETAGPRANQVLAFARRIEKSWAIAVIPRWRPFDSDATTRHRGSLSADWHVTSLALPASAPTEWTDTLTGQNLRISNNVLPLDDVLSLFPTALLLASR